MGAADTGFWDFSLRLYDRPGVADACLQLQDRCGADVNLLLLGFWRAHRGFPRWEPGELARAEMAAAPVNAALRPLRQARRALRALQTHEPAAESLYRDAKALELKLEQVAQGWLAAASWISPTTRDSAGDERAAAERHLQDYIAHVAPGSEEAERLAAALLDAAFA